MLFKSEQKNDDMLDIMKTLHKYVPMMEKTSREVVEVDGVEEEITVQTKNSVASSLEGTNSL